MAKNWCKDYPDVDLTPYEYILLTKMKIAKHLIMKKV